MRPIASFLPYFALPFLTLSPLRATEPELIFDRAGAEIFPESWRNAKVNANAEPLDETGRQAAKAIVGRALAKYPPAVLSANLKELYAVGRLEYSGVATGGTNSRDAVYVVWNPKFPADKIEGNIHAEFSSILLRNHAREFDQEAWLKLNPPGFAYRGTGVQAVRTRQASLRIDAVLNAEGFVNQYGQASMEEDFNSYAGRLWMGDAELWNAIEKYPKVKAKADLAMAFYQKLDGALTEQFFRSLRRPRER